MNIRKHEYVEYIFPPFYESKKIEKHTDKREVLSENIPEGCIGYRFYARNVAYAQSDILRGNPRDISFTFYLNAEGVETLDEQGVREKFFEKVAFARDIMGKQKCSKIVVTRSGDFFPFKEGDKIF
ncbi:MAG: hypothetical protein Q7S74_06610 [Nanoarchaeota archaeon]|nr:hypothetical protein [Nanoarchaeota archaeon]